MEEVQTVKYEFNKIGADDIFTMVSIISKIGVNKFSQCLQGEEMRELVSKLKSNKNVTKDDISIVAGAGVLLNVAQVIFEGMPKCKDDIYKLLSDTSNLSLEEVKALDGVTFFEMIIDFVKKEEFMDFIKAASKFAKKGN